VLTRREFAASAAAAALTSSAVAQAPNPIAHGRPPAGLRAFTSPAVERAILAVQRQLVTSGIRGKLAKMVANCLPNTLDTTVELGTRDGRPDTFVITGDIHAMWLRDSTAQVWPYLRFAREDPRLASLLRGVVERQTASVLLDPYANAFNRDLVPSPEHADDETEMKPGVFERKWELDSLCSAIRLAHGYWRASGDSSPFDARWREASRMIVATMRAQQRKHGPGPYRFQRRTDWSPDSVPGNGYGNPVRPVGLIVSLFRPSDDAAIFPFLVPANAYAVVMLRRLAAMHEKIHGDAAFAGECRALAAEVERALRTHALVEHSRHARLWAYEVDGYGNALFMDDANVPNLLSLPYLGWCAPSDPVYRRTRSLVLSADNPWFHRGRSAEGVGSPHTPGRRIWPIAIAMRALTSTDDGEIALCLRILAMTDANTGFMHEAFDADDPSIFSRPWFAWANSLFGELMLKVATQRPHVFSLLDS
jgi:meiotically up-regulated gene 157 (Mug157) protein